jgi:hypothetical protein
MFGCWLARDSCSRRQFAAPVARLGSNNGNVKRVQVTGGHSNSSLLISAHQRSQGQKLPRLCACAVHTLCMQNCIHTAFLGQHPAATRHPGNTSPPQLLLPHTGRKDLPIPQALPHNAPCFNNRQRNPGPDATTSRGCVSSHNLSELGLCWGVVLEHLTQRQL